MTGIEAFYTTCGKSEKCLLLLYLGSVHMAAWRNHFLRCKHSIGGSWHS